MIEFAGQPIHSFRDLQIAAKNLKPHDEVSLTLLRSGKKITLKIKLGGALEKPTFGLSVA